MHLYRIKNLGVRVGEDQVVVNDTFGAAYVLNFTSDTEGKEHTLYVSQTVKRLFYPKMSVLDLKPV
jgi:hypothetical protein